LCEQMAARESREPMRFRAKTAVNPSMEALREHPCSRQSWSGLPPARPPHSRRRRVFMNNADRRDRTARARRKVRAILHREPSLNAKYPDAPPTFAARSTHEHAGPSIGVVDGEGRPFRIVANMDVRAKPPWMGLRRS